MNRYFEFYESREFPRRSYARIDSVEPPGQVGEEVTIAFDAVDASWDLFDLFGRAGPDAGYVKNQLARFWKQRFNGSRDGADPFDRMPLYRVEMSLPRHHPWMKEIPILEDAWFELELDSQGELEVEVFPSLFAPATIAYLHGPPSITPFSEALDQVFDASSWPDQTADRLLGLLEIPCELLALVALDVGQGSAIGLYCTHGAKYYFDVGCGAHGNAHTRPNPVQFCDCNRPPIILSHWDADHWAGAIADKALLARNWIVPRQKGLLPSHFAFANSILSAGGTISVFPASLSPFAWTAGTETYTILQCTGTTRNGSGLALSVTQLSTGLSWLLTGDAGYAEIPNGPLQLAAVTVPHHGADMTHVGSPPPPARRKYRRSVYSFGPGNKFGKYHVQHPVAVTVADHQYIGWNQGAWTAANPPATTIAGQDVLATAMHLTVHIGGAAVGFTGAPALPLHSCPKSMPITQT